jgi:hypothetical protein
MRYCSIFWQKQQSLRQLIQLSEPEEVAAINVAIGAGISMLDLRAQHTVPNQVLRLEFAILRMAAVELRTPRKLCGGSGVSNYSAGLNIHLTIDRIDRLHTDNGEGALVVIDYKTVKT